MGLFSTAAAAFVLFGAPAFAQQMEAIPRPAGEVVHGYLPDGAIDFRALLPAPPAQGSIIDNLDVAAVKSLQGPDTADRFRTAEQDALFIYPRFEAVFGGPIDRVHTPALVHLLNRVEEDVRTPTFAAKGAYGRSRPYERFQLSRVCGLDPSKPITNAGSSYPSGHTAWGWGAALVLAEVAPDRREALLERARDYELSRVICGVHYPSDIEAGRALGTAVVMRLHANPAFMADLAAAQLEHAHGKR